MDPREMFSLGSWTPNTLKLIIFQIPNDNSAEIKFMESDEEPKEKKTNLEMNCS